MSQVGEPGAGSVGTMVAGADIAGLWVEFGPTLRRFLARRVPPGVDVDDLVQDVFVRVIRGVNSLRRAERLESWLFQIARNALKDALRARRRREGRTDPLENEPPTASAVEAEHAAEAELAPCLIGMIGRLAEPYRTAISLTSLHGMTQVDAARQVGVSVSGMKSRVQRGRAQLREMLVTCCAIAVDVRGGVSDFHVREPGACADPGTCGQSHSLVQLLGARADSEAEVAAECAPASKRR